MPLHLIKLAVGCDSVKELKGWVAERMQTAKKKGLPLHQLDPLRERISCLTSHGGLTGVPQINLPGATVDGAPVGLSIIGARGSDLDLLRVAVAFEAQAAEKP